MINLELNDILFIICKKYNFSELLIFKKSKKKEIIKVRYMFFYFAQYYNKYKLHQIVNYILIISGSKFDHSTLIHGRNKISEEQRIYPEIDKEIREILFELKKRNNQILTEDKFHKITVQDVDLLKMAQLNTINVII